MSINTRQRHTDSKVNVDRRLRVIIKLKMVADIFFYNEKYFSHMFKERIGVNFTGYLNELRVRRALSLIDGNAASVQELSAKCGFNDSYYFSKVFKKHVGLSPSQYAKQKRIGD